MQDSWTKRKIYTYKNKKILDVNWGTFHENAEKHQHTVYQGENACRQLQGLMREKENSLVLVHHNHHWSFMVIDHETETVASYDSGSGQGHKRLTQYYVVLWRSVRRILEGERTRWSTQGATVSKQTDGRSCGYRMLSCIQDFYAGKKSEKKREDQAKPMQCTEDVVSKTWIGETVRRIQSGGEGGLGLSAQGTSEGIRRWDNKGTPKRADVQEK